MIEAIAVATDGGGREHDQPLVVINEGRFSRELETRWCLLRVGFLVEWDRATDLDGSKRFG